jgi:1-deoxy-D-xylulose-5-phosphate synthase
LFFSVMISQSKSTDGLESDTPLLDTVDCPADLRSLNVIQLRKLCDELRLDLIKRVNQIGGHFASSLGVVELTVALHTAFNTPHDRIIWDVGHQAYIHKILTGRREKLLRARRMGGISGFPSRSESEYDAFGAGHAGTSISAAAGMVEACHHNIPGREDRRVVAVIGDGAMTAGMAFEALNHSGQLRRKLIVVLNDNEMSIAPNVGALSWAFSKTLTGKLSTSARRHFKSLVEHGLIPKTFYHALDRAEDVTQGFFSLPAMLFESFGYRYIGPIDGHNLNQLIQALERAKEQDCPVLVHAQTVKGKGYEPAEKDPVKYHAVGPFTLLKNEGAKGAPHTVSRSYTDVFGKSMLELCRKDPRVVGITAAMPDGTGLDLLAREMPERFYDVAIAEQHAVTFAAGLAAEGMRPVCAIYSSFLQRSFDQIMHDVCLQSLPVIFALDRAGIVGEDGPTHHGLFDLAYLRIFPNMTVMAPKDEAELRDMLFAAVLHSSGPVAIRYPRGIGLGVSLPEIPRQIPVGRAEVLRKASHAGRAALILALGQTVYPALDAAKDLLADGIQCTVVNTRFVKPLDEKLLHDLIDKHALVLTVEDHVLQGGFGSAVVEFMSDTGLAAGKPVIRLGVDDFFVTHGTQKELRRNCGIDKQAIRSQIAAVLGHSHVIPTHAAAAV